MTIMAEHGTKPDAQHGHGEAKHGGTHVVPVRILVATGLALLVFTWLTVAATKVDLGEMNIFIALGIAVIKGSLVALYFMHLRWDRPFNGIVFIGSLAFVTLLISLVLVDTSEYQPELKKGDAKRVIETIQQVEQEAEQGSPSS
jgi:cytochrome c oxidase subunit 4